MEKYCGNCNKSFKTDIHFKKMTCVPTGGKKININSFELGIEKNTNYYGDKKDNTFKIKEVR